MDKQISISLDEPTYDTLKAKARAEGSRSMASLIREILARYSSRVNKQPPIPAENLVSTPTI